MSQKTDNLIKLALVFFVSLLSFSIGTYVGKKYSDNQHKLSLLEPKKDDGETKAATADFATESAAAKTADKAALPTSHAEELTNINADEKPAALTDTEVAKIAEEFAHDEESSEEKLVGTIDPDAKPVGQITSGGKKVAATTHRQETAVTEEIKNIKPEVKETPKTVPVATHKTETAVEPTPVAKTTVAPTTHSTALPAKTIAKSESNDEIKPTPTDERTAQEREPASIPPKQEIIPIHYTVQIGSFPTETEAATMTKSLQGKGYKTSFVPATVNGQTWYRVNVGLFGTVKEAQDYKKEFLEKTKLTSAIVQRLQH
ncbi:MAG: SPOR domain-containing protein [Pseudobdellovibrio sp.]